MLNQKMAVISKVLEVNGKYEYEKVETLKELTKPNIFSLFFSQGSFTQLGM